MNLRSVLHSVKTAAVRNSAELRVEEDENIADLSPYDKYKQISSYIRL